MSALDLAAIGSRIKGLRQSRTQQEFADLVGVSRVTIARYEGGTRSPDAEFLVQAHEVLGVDPIWLLTGQGQEPRQQQPQLMPDEQLVLQGYRQLDARGRAGVMALIGGMAPQAAAKQTFHGPVGISGGKNKIKGEIEVTAKGVTIAKKKTLK